MRISTIDIFVFTTANMKKATSVDGYIADFPQDVQVKLMEIRALIKKTAPKAEESISYGMPGYKLNGPLVYFGGFKNHIGFFPTGEGVAAFQDELTGYKTSKGTIQLPLDKPLPKTLITKIVKHRMQVNAAKAKK